MAIAAAILPDDMPLIVAAHLAVEHQQQLVIRDGRCILVPQAQPGDQRIAVLVKGKP